MTVDPVFLVTNECTQITSAMRKNSRWAQAGMTAILGVASLADDTDPSNDSLVSRWHLRPDSNNPLIAGFAKLKTRLALAPSLENIPGDTILAPFLDVISSQSATGPITLIALSAITKFFDYNVITPTSINIHAVIAQLAFAITHCRFEATDHAEDDAVLLKILALMQLLVAGVGSPFLNDESLCDIIETCLSMACQMKRGDLLRRSAEMTMLALTQAIFARLADIDADPGQSADLLQLHEPEGEFGGEEKGEKSELSDPGMDPTSDQDGPAADPTTKQDDPTSELSEPGADQDAPTFISPNSLPQLLSQPAPAAHPFQPYGIPAIREYLRVLISIIDTSNAYQYSDNTRIMVLNLINTAFEVAGSEIGRFPSLLDLTTSALLKNILLLIRSDNLLLLQKTLAVSATIFHTSRKHLKLQHEFYLIYLLSCLSPIADIPREDGVDEIFYSGVPSVPSSVLNASNTTTTTTTVTTNNNTTITPNFIYSKSPEAREMMVEALTGLARIPSYFVDLYVNYDCDIDRADLCQDLIGFLCRSAYPDAASWSTFSVPPLCLDALLSFLSTLVSRIDSPPPPPSPKELAFAKLADTNKDRKKLVIEATTLFNEKPAKGVRLIVEKGLVHDDSPAAVLAFLQSSGRIDKKVLGEFVSGFKNTVYLDLFINSFDFQDQTLDEAMRDLCAAIRLPGESQCIERIMEKFAERYCFYESNVKHVADKDAAFVLSYAVILLNTDLHSPKVKSRMSRQDFGKNLRNVNAGFDFDPQYLDIIYNSIRDREIVMPEEHDNDESFEYTWRELSLKANVVPDALACKTNLFDKHLFETAWKPIVATLSYIFATATEDTVFSRVISGLRNVSRVASHYKIPGVIDQVIYSLGKISTLTYGDFATPDSSVQITTDAKLPVVVSDFSVQFGDDFKAQLASIVLFKIATSNHNVVASSWSQLLSIAANLYLHSLLSPQFALDLEQEYNFPPLPPVDPVYVAKPRENKDTSLFSALSSYLSGYNDAVPEPSEEEIESTLSALDCINSSNINVFLRDAVRSAPAEIVRGIVQMPPPALTGLSQASRHRFYPVVLYLLHVATLAAARDPDSQLDVLLLVKHYTAEWELDDPAFLGRCLAGAFALIQHGTPALAPHIEPLLAHVAGANEQTLLPCVPHFFAELLALAAPDVWCRDTVVSLGPFWTLLERAAAHAECADRVLAFAQSAALTESTAQPVLAVLAAVARRGACGAQLEQDKTAIAVALRKQHDQQTAIRLAKTAIAEMEEDVRRALDAVDALAAAVPAVLPPAPAWFPYLEMLVSLAASPCRRVRARALAALQAACLSPALRRPDFDWPHMLRGTCFGLADALLRPETYAADPAGMPLSRVQCAALLSKVFLQYVSAPSAAVAEYWPALLDRVARLLAGRRAVEDAALAEADEELAESVKNLLLVIKAGEPQAPPFWEEAWEKLGGVVDGISKEMVMS